MNALSALDILKHPQSGDESDIKEAMQCAISALEKQMPKKPIETSPDGHSDYYCGVCDAFLGDDSEIGADCLKPTYCLKCGQAIAWSKKNIF